MNNWCLEINKISLDSEKEVVLSSQSKFESDCNISTPLNSKQFL